MSKKLTLLATALAIGSAEKDMFCAQSTKEQSPRKTFIRSNEK